MFSYLIATCKIPYHCIGDLGFDRFGDSHTNSQILAADGIPVPLDGPKLLR